MGNRACGRGGRSGTVRLMNTLSPSDPAEPRAMTAASSLFDADTEANPGVHTPGSPPSLFADIVFDRPLDHAFTYSVPEQLAGRIGVGKRVEAPLGKGSKSTSGFCVRVTDQRPSFDGIKPVTRVLD